MSSAFRFLGGGVLVLFVILYPDRVGLFVSALVRAIVNIAVSIGDNVWIPGSNGKQAAAAVLLPSLFLVDWKQLRHDFHQTTHSQETHND